jgi:hypothetical protein
MNLKQCDGHLITKTFIEMAQGHSQKCRFEDQIFSLEIWHIWITFATTWFIFAKQILFPISK